MSLFDAPLKPASELAKPRILSPNASVRVSPLQLGAMSLGDAWKGWMGSIDKAAAFKLLDAFYEQGGNFIDTSPNYQDEQSELWLGEWMKERGVRDQMVIATKYTTNYKAYELKKQIHASNFGGNGKKNMHLSTAASLKNLQTDYIDIMYLHWWDWATSIEEVMNGLDDLVKSGKVLYLGVSDTPAWVVSAANTYAKAHGKAQFVIYQGRWNIMMRDFERDILPMARQFGMALAPWDVLGGGRLQTKKQIAEREARGEKVRSFDGKGLQTEQEEKMSAALEKVAGEVGVDSIQAVALAYVMSKAQYVFPIVGGKRVEHLMDNIKALTIKLTDEQIHELEAVVAFDVGFPSNMVGTDPHFTDGGPNLMIGEQFNLVWQKDGAPIGHAPQ